MGFGSRDPGSSHLVDIIPRAWETSTGPGRQEKEERATKGGAGGMLWAIEEGMHMMSPTFHGHVAAPHQGGLCGDYEPEKEELLSWWPTASGCHSHLVRL